MSTTPPQKQAGQIETRGIQPVPEDERQGRARDLIWVWFAANIGILAVSYGADLVTNRGLSLWEIVLVTVIGAAGSFFLVGLLSIAGKWGGAPTLTLSRAAFGVRGNRGPTLLSWVSLVGWEAVQAVTATYAVVTLLNKIFGVSEASDLWIVASLVIVVLLSLIAGLFGYATIVVIQRWATYIFGAMTVLVVVLIAVKVDWHQVSRMPSAPAVDVIAAIGFIAAGTGIGWINSGADYSRYLPRRTSGSSIALWVTVGASVPLFVLIVLGGLMAVADHGLASAANPVSAIEASLPGWMTIPYLVTAAVGLIAAVVLNLYSSGLNLLALGLPATRTVAVAIDGVLMAALGVYVMIIAKNFYGPFVTFLTLLAVPLSAWAAVFGVDMAKRRGYDVPSLMRVSPDSAYWYTGGVSIPAIVAWILGIVVGLLFTTAQVSATDTWFTGPLASTWLGRNDLGWLIALVVAGVLYAAGSGIHGDAPRATEASTPPDPRDVSVRARVPVT